MQIWYFAKIIIILLLYTLWLECCPSLGNIWLRPDHTGDIKFRPGNLVRFLFGPLNPSSGYIFWNPELFDINFIIFFLSFWFMLDIIPYSANLWSYVLETKSTHSDDKENK